MLLLLALPALASPDPAAVAVATWRAGLGRSEVPVQAQVELLAWPGGWRARVHPVVDGLPVDGASPVVAIDPQGRAVRIGGPQVQPAPIPRGALDAEAARARAHALGAQLGEGSLWPPRVTEVAHAGPAGLAHAWRVELGVVEPLGVWTAWVDATDGSVRALHRSSHQATGHAFPRSPVAGPLAEVELEHLLHDEVLHGRYADVWSCAAASVDLDPLGGEVACTTVTRQARPLGGDWRYLPRPAEPTDPFGEVNLYHQVTRVASWFDDRYGLRDPAPLRVYTNFTMSNAFYGDFDGDGRGDLAFGTGWGQPAVPFGYDADVVAHEFGHWVIGRVARLPWLAADSWGMEWAGGALNEGASDVFAMTFSGSPALGEWAGQALRNGPIRDLSVPRRCPEDLRGQVHHDGQVLGSLGWQLIQEIGPDRTSDLLIGAAATWDLDISWAVAGQSLLESAQDLRAAGALDEAAYGRAVARIEASGMPDCGRSIALDDGLPRDTSILSVGLQGTLERLPGGVQFAIDLGADPERLVVQVDGLLGPPGLGWSLFARCGDPVQHEVASLPSLGLAFPVPVAWDWLVDGEGSTGALTLDASSDPPLPDGGTCYVAVAGRSTGELPPFELTTGLLTLSAQVQPASPPPDPRGCAHAPLGAAGLLAGWALAVARRRPSDGAA